MRSNYKFYWIVVIALCFSFSAFAQETITLTTYYPAPFGVYRQLVTATLGVGDNDGSNTANAADSPDPATDAGDVWVFGDVGLGTPNPRSRLDVSGAALIGAGYAGNNAITPPANGLLVEGDVGIGTTNAGFTSRADTALNHIKFLPTNNPNYAIEGGLYYDDSENNLKYHDGANWRSAGGVQRGATTEVTSAVVANASRPPAEGAEGARASCPDRSVMTGLTFYAGCNIGGSPNDCSTSSEVEVFRITQIGVDCTALE